MAKTIGQLTQATTLAGADEFIIEQSGLTKRVAASVVRGGLINSDIDAAAAIAFSKLAALDSANILVGNGSNVATKVAVTGDVTISNAGVTAIGSSKVVTAMVNDAAITPAKLSQPLTLATAQATTSGTSIDFTGIPSWAKRITLILSGVSTNGTSNLQVQIGAGSVTTSGYNSSAWTATTVVSGNVTSGFLITAQNAAASVYHGSIAVLTLGSNLWAENHTIGGQPNNYQSVGGGSIALGGTLDRVRLTTVNGADTFDGGSVNIMYEG
jgi:hypothetical protein